MEDNNNVEQGYAIALIMNVVIIGLIILFSNC